jgi:hypothetical protein
LESILDKHLSVTWRSCVRLIEFSALSGIRAGNTLDVRLCFSEKFAGCVPNRRGHIARFPRRQKLADHCAGGCSANNAE